MSNFSYLSTRPEYSLFANSAIEAEKVFSTSPAMCAVGCRKALELAVKWVYAADKTITMPYKDNLQSLLHEPSFRFAVDRNVWSVLPSIVKAGNLAVHTGHSVSAADAVFSLRGLFDFIQWVDYCYGTDYVERSFDETAIPGEKVALDEKKIREQESLLTQKDAELEALRKQVESLSAAYTASKQQNQQSRSFTAADLTEAETRRKIIDIDLKAMGWKFTGPDADVRTEYEVDNMNGVLGQKGYADYVLMGKDGLPLAVIEAKRSTKDPNIGRKQAQLYADCLEQKFGRRPMLFTTNGYTTYFWDEQSGPQRAGERRPRNRGHLRPGLHGDGHGRPSGHRGRRAEPLCPKNRRHTPHGAPDRTPRRRAPESLGRAGRPLPLRPRALHRAANHSDRRALHAHRLGGGDAGTVGDSGRPAGQARRREPRVLRLPHRSRPLCRRGRSDHRRGHRTPRAGRMACGRAYQRAARPPGDLRHRGGQDGDSRPRILQHRGG